MIDKLDINLINTLTISELYVLRYMDKNKKTTIDSSIKELADLTFVSTATVVRVAKKIGFSGFTELKYALKKELDAEVKEDDERIGKDNFSNIKLSLLNEIKLTSAHVIMIIRSDNI